MDARPFNDDERLFPTLVLISPLPAGDTALGGELSELAGFYYLRSGDDKRARAFLDTAATYYYVSRLNDGAGRLAWASTNVDKVRDRARADAKLLDIPPGDE